ncbi:MAG: site-2 protease family protein, partial [Bullifex sp.]
MSAIITFTIQFLIGFAAISLVLMVHELGHFMAAKLLHVSVDEFRIGMGPKLFTVHGRITDFSVCLIPLGGCTRMKGSEDLTKALRDQAKSFETSEKGSYFTSAPFVRFIIFLSGPLINIVLSVLIFTLISFIP